MMEIPISIRQRILAKRGPGLLHYYDNNHAISFLPIKNDRTLENKPYGKPSVYDESEAVQPRFHVEFKLNIALQNMSMGVGVGCLVRLLDG